MAGDRPLYLDPVGSKNPAIAFSAGSTWKTVIDDVDGSQFFQARLTFVSDVATGSSPVLSGLGFAWDLAD